MQLYSRDEESTELVFAKWFDGNSELNMGLSSPVPFLGIYPQVIASLQSNTSIQIFMTAVFTGWKNSRLKKTQKSVNRWMGKLWYFHMVDYYSIIKRE